MARIAVLTGDLVHSTDLGPEKIERAFAALEDCARTQAEWHGAPLHFTRHRGDGWQVVLARPEMALRSALAFRAALRTEGDDFDSYIGIADAYMDKTISDDLNKETAHVFAASGSALEFAKATSDYRFSYHGQAFLEAVTTLVDYISKDWTPVQAASVYPLIEPESTRTFTDVAGLLGKSRQAVTKSIEAAGWHRLDYALKCIEGSTNA